MHTRHCPGGDSNAAVGDSCAACGDCGPNLSKHDSSAAVGNSCATCGGSNAGCVADS